MTNEQIDRGIEALEEVRFKHTSYYQIRCVLEAMKEPEVKGIYIDPEYREQFDKDVARDIKIGTPDPIREVYDKYGKLSVHDMSHDGLVNAFINMRNAITQHCEEEE